MKLFIDGNYVDAIKGETFVVKNPATGEIVDNAAKGDREDVKKAVDAAEKGFEEWSSVAALRRASVLVEATRLIRENEQELSVTLTKEQGKPLHESIREMRNFCRTLEYYAGVAGKLRGSQVALSEPEKYGMVIKQPVGICGAIVAWNFPVALMGWKVAPALIAGNSIIIKPASTAPLTNTKLAKILSDAGVSRGAINAVTGPGGTVGQEILESPKIRKIAFTGETGTGRDIMRVSAQQVKRLTLELGGSDPMIVCDDANLEIALDAALWGRFRNCGQSCNAVKRLILFEKISDEFTERLVEMARDIRVGNGLDPKTDMGPMNNSSQREEVEAQISEAVQRGAKLLLGGKRPDGAEYSKGFFLEPTILADVDIGLRVATEEVFGPALPIFVATDLEEAVNLANDSIYGLGASIWTRDLQKANEAIQRIQAGTIWVNSYHESNVELPFGGFKQSGLGRELGLEGLDAYVELKSVVISYNPIKKTWS